jgi:hypothetical protein
VEGRKGIESFNFIIQHHAWCVVCCVEGLEVMGYDGSYC